MPNTDKFCFVTVLYQREDEFCDRLNNRATFKGFTALHYAVLRDDYNLIKILLESGADPTIENESGHKAADYTDNEKVKELLVVHEKKVGRR